MFCTYCGKKQNSNATSCQYCGCSIGSGTLSGESSVNPISNSPSAQAPLPEAARSGYDSGKITATYASPEGFELDPQSPLYYRNEAATGLDTGEPVQWITWFHPDTGKYEQISYPVETPQPMQPTPVQVATPVQRPQSSEPQIQIPEGFTLDPSSGLYYISKTGSDPATGTNGNWYTWFTPSSGEYRQSFHPGVSVPQSLYTHDANGVRNPAVQTSGKPAPAGKKRKGSVIPIVLPLIALLVGAGLAFFQSGGFSRFSEPATLEIPEGIQIVSLDPTNIPQFQPISSDVDDSTVEVEQQPITLNMDSLSMIGRTNAELKEISNSTCRRSYLMYGDGMVADYSETSALYPLAFWVSGGSYEEIAEIWDVEADGGNPVEGRNIWSDHFTISMIEAWDKDLHIIFEDAFAITFEAMSNSFDMIGEVYHYASEDQADYVYGFDVWECTYEAGEYAIAATFYEANGEKVLLNVKIWNQDY